MRAELVYSFAKRELLGRYKGSVLGIAWAVFTCQLLASIVSHVVPVDAKFLGDAWAVLTPAVMIAIFTIVFSGIFGFRFSGSASHWDFALYLFCGLLPWTMFQESVQQSANTILAHANLVKRVVFPLEKAG